MQFGSYTARQGLSAEEAAADFEGPRIVAVEIPKHHCTGTCSCSDAVSLVVEARKAVPVVVGCCLSANELPKVAGKVNLEYGRLSRLLRGDWFVFRPGQRRDSHLPVGTPAGAVR